MLTVIVQAGGESSRMGQDKALMPFMGIPLVQRVLERLQPMADEMAVITNRPAEYDFLNVPLFADVLPGRGALGGLYTALQVATQPFVLLAACDMPFVNPDLLALQRDLLVKKEVDAVIPKTDHGIEPFHAIYRRSTCLPAVEQVLQAGKWRVDSWLSAAQVCFLAHPDVHAINKMNQEDFLLSFWNLNTPEDYQKAEERVRNSP
jgi:molybdopterin-guanine dinucleotide biosynthesis protein A